MIAKNLSLLITCPPMLRSIERYRELLSEQGIHPVCPQMVQTMTEDELIAEVPKHDAWIIGDDPATARVFSSGVAGKLKAAVKWGVGIDNVDLEGASSVGLQVSNTPGMFSDEVADIAMSYVTGLAREVFSLNAGVWANQWPKPVGMSLKDKQVALLGFGNIGREAAARLVAAKMKVTVYDPAVSNPVGLGNMLTYGRWPDGLGEADFLVLTCNLTKTTHHIVNADLMQQCKPGVRIINVSRGALIDEFALAEALKNGIVHSAALEVFEREPLPASSELRNFKNCIFGSHNASNTQEAVDRTSLNAIELLKKQLSVR